MGLVMGSCCLFYKYQVPDGTNQKDISICRLDNKFENRMNELVYQLYDLTEVEIKIVEGE
jgi:hypothetical protein